MISILRIVIIFFRSLFFSQQYAIILEAFRMIFVFLFLFPSPLHFFLVILKIYFKYVITSTAKYLCTAQAGKHDEYNA